MSSPNGVAGTSSGNSNSSGNVVYSTIAPLKIRTSPMSNGTDSKSPTKSPISPSQPFPIIKSSGPVSPRHSPRLRSPSSSRGSRSPSSPHAATLIIHMKKGEPSTGTTPLGLPSPSGSSSAGKLSSPGRNEKDRRASLASSESSGCSSDRSSILRSPIDARKENGKPLRSGSGTTSTSSGERMTSENDENRNNISSTSGGGISDVRGLLKGYPSEIIHHHPVFVKDTSKYWYKPTISREQAINMLRDKPPGTFVVRDSNSFPGAFGLALKVAQPPPGVQPGDGTELVRHFLIEPSPKGVKLKGCNNEPVFGSLSALVYQHSITPLALPAKLLLPDFDPAATPEHISAAQALLEQGAACNVSYVGSIDVESLTGAECIKRSISYTVEEAISGEFKPVSVHFKVSSQGVTLTDNTRKAFFRRHFPVNSVIYAGMDPVERRFDNSLVLGCHEGCVTSARMFGFVARKPSSMENACHVFAEFEPEQPASAVVNFINKVMLAQRRQ
ncbi:hypothetical protein WR25_05926 [Diploscapter pachys]|uniref:SH2 domain-containing protein n=1 Tax=Diploscapter pachys TaxID=2018661 RepID=A0A2A2J0Y2_9BILA|nr:hypothetical protein WR25_05926 [Diploscapter pachys]